MNIIGEKEVKEMIDAIPEELWQRSQLKVLDPCAGNGNFPAYLALKTETSNIYCNEISPIRYTNLSNYFENTDINLMSIVCIILWVFLHEILHSVGFMSLGKVKGKNVVFGIENLNKYIKRQKMITNVKIKNNIAIINGVRIINRLPTESGRVSKAFK